MTADVEIRTDPTLRVSGVCGLTDRGVEFVEAIPDPVRVIDADRVIVRMDDVAELERRARVLGLVVDRDVVARLVR